MKQLATYKYHGFWAAMDTFKEKMLLEEMYSRGKAPWELWRSASRLVMPDVPAAGK
jgi:glucose-1-phosphate cytidylyltransferase